MRGTGSLAGNPDLLHSTRAERSGLIGPLFEAWSVAESQNIKGGMLTMHIDNTLVFEHGNPTAPGEGIPRQHVRD